MDPFQIWDMKKQKPSRFIGGPIALLVVQGANHAHAWLEYLHRSCSNSFVCNFQGQESMLLNKFLIIH